MFPSLVVVTTAHLGRLSFDGGKTASPDDNRHAERVQHIADQ